MHSFRTLAILLCAAALAGLSACDALLLNTVEVDESEAVLLVIDEESIDNGNEPNNFSETDVNDQLADVGLRDPLAFFEANAGKTIDLYTGEVGDEGWFALSAIPQSWTDAGPRDNGAINYLTPGPGLGAGDPDDDREILLDKVPDVTPLRAEGLSMLVGKTVLAVVYDSDVSINYSPLLGNLQGANLGLVAFEVLRAVERRDGSTGSLPRVTVRIRSVEDISALPLTLFRNAPVPSSSSEPYDTVPPDSIPAIETVPAN
ncbi:MAG: hypothetical protein NW241_21940 [Bacteroidia bacterium]|nr:hypothetical protein [Bacteroidia bacterium]